jgi:hypothetical protein
MQNDGGNQVSTINYNEANAQPQGQQQEPKPKTIVWKRVLKIALICLGALAGFLLICWLLSAFLPGRAVKDTFIIGNITITRQQIEEYAEAITREGAFYGEQDNRTDIERALDDLVLNAALKEEANRCRIAVPNIYISFTATKIGQTTQENLSLKSALKFCSVKNKNVFGVSVRYASAYFTSMSGNDANKAYADSKAWL